jgi:hypothetical protein
MADERDNPGNATGGGDAVTAIHSNAEDGGKQVSHDDRDAKAGRTEVVRESEGQKSSKAAPAKSTILNEDQMFDTLEKYVAAALEDEIVAFNSIKIKRTWPESYKELVKFMNGKTQMGEMDDETIMGVFMYSPRTVIYNFFDYKKIFVNIFGSDQHWRYTMEANESSEEIYPNRTLCEVAAYIEAFNRLEKQLNTKK